VSDAYVGSETDYKNTDIMDPVWVRDFLKRHQEPPSLHPPGNTDGPHSWEMMQSRNDRSACHRDDGFNECLYRLGPLDPKPDVEPVSSNTVHELVLELHCYAAEFGIDNNAYRTSANTGSLSDNYHGEVCQPTNREVLVNGTRIHCDPMAAVNIAKSAALDENRLIFAHQQLQLGRSGGDFAEAYKQLGGEETTKAFTAAKFGTKWKFSRYNEKNREEGIKKLAEKNACLGEMMALEKRRAYDAAKGEDPLAHWLFIRPDTLVEVLEFMRRSSSLQYPVPFQVMTMICSHVDPVVDANKHIHKQQPKDPPPAYILAQKHDQPVIVPCGYAHAVTNMLPNIKVAMDFSFKGTLHRSVFSYLHCWRLMDKSTSDYSNFLGIAECETINEQG